MYYLYSDPTGQNIIAISNRYEDKLSSLEDRIKQLEAELSTLKKTRRVGLFVHYLCTLGHRGDIGAWLLPKHQTGFPHVI